MATKLSQVSWGAIGILAVGLSASTAWAQSSPGAGSTVNPDGVLRSANIYAIINQVELLPATRGATPRAAAIDDRVAPRDRLATRSASRAAILFNEGTIIRVDEATQFLFETGLRQFQVQAQAITLAEANILLEQGAIAVISPEAGGSSQVETPQGFVIVAAGQPGAVRPPEATRWATRLEHLKAMVSQESATLDPVLLGQHGAPTDADPGAALDLGRRNAVLIRHDLARATMEVIALTDGDITVLPRDDRPVSLQGGQAVAVIAGRIICEPYEIELRDLYQRETLIQGLGPGQGGLIDQEPTPAQATLRDVQSATLAAVENQGQRNRGFSHNFVGSVLAQGACGAVGGDTFFNEMGTPPAGGGPTGSSI